MGGQPLRNDGACRGGGAPARASQAPHRQRGRGRSAAGGARIDATAEAPAAAGRDAGHLAQTPLPETPCHWCIGGEGGVEVGDLTSQHTGATTNHNNYSVAARAAVRGRRLEWMGSARPFAAERRPPPAVVRLPLCLNRRGRHVGGGGGRALQRAVPVTKVANAPSRAQCRPALEQRRGGGRWPTRPPRYGRGRAGWRAGGECRRLLCWFALREWPAGRAGASGGASGARPSSCVLW